MSFWFGRKRTGKRRYMAPHLADLWVQRERNRVGVQKRLAGGTLKSLVGTLRAIYSRGRSIQNQVFLIAHFFFLGGKRAQYLGHTLLGIRSNAPGDEIV